MNYLMTSLAVVLIFAATVNSSESDGVATGENDSAQECSAENYHFMCEMDGLDCSSDLECQDDESCCQLLDGGIEDIPYTCCIKKESSEEEEEEPTTGENEDQGTTRRRRRRRV